MTGGSERGAGVKPAAGNRGPWPPVLIWWVLWLGLLAGYLQVCYLGRHLRPPASAAAVVLLVGAGCVALSAACRWLLLPRVARAPVAFILFLVGLALAEACGYVGIFLGGPFRDALVAGGGLGMLQFLPRFARRFFVAPAAAAGMGSKPGPGEAAGKDATGVAAGPGEGPLV